MWLVELYTAVFILGRRLVRVESIGEQFWFNRHVWMHVAQLEPRMEAVSLLLLEHFVALRRPSWSLRHWSPLRSLVLIHISIRGGLRWS